MFGFINGKYESGFVNVFVSVLNWGLVNYILFEGWVVYIDFVVRLVGFCLVGICVYCVVDEDEWICFILFDM